MTSAPNDLITVFSPQKHSFEVQTHLEIVPPNCQSVELGVIDVVWNEFYFQVSLLSNPDRHFLCHKHSDIIFHVGWSEKLRGEVVTKVKSQLAERGRKKVARSIHFPIRDDDKNEEIFEMGHKLEIVYEGKFRTGTIRGRQSGILKVELDSDKDEKTIIMIPSKSLDIFPFGWSLSNGLSCWVPKSFLLKE